MFGKSAIVFLATAPMALAAATLLPVGRSARTPASIDLITVNYPYCYENPWDRATCLKDDMPAAGHKAGMHSPRGRKHVD
jgi:hypothetical protein